MTTPDRQIGLWCAGNGWRSQSLWWQVLLAPLRQQPDHEAALLSPLSTADVEMAQPPLVTTKPAAKAATEEAEEPVPAQAAPLAVGDQLARANLLRRDGRWRDAESVRAARERIL